MENSKMNPLDQKLEELVKDRRAVPKDTSIVEVEINANVEIVRCLYDAMKLKVMNKITDLGFTLEEFTLYIRTIFSWRINFLTGKRNPTMAKYVRVPALINLTLAQIGECYDKSYGLLFKPQKSKDLEESTLDFKDIKDCDEKTKAWIAIMEKVSTRLQTIVDYGFSFAIGVPRNPEGELGVMCFNLMGEMVRCYVPDKHVSKAMIATVASLAALKSTMTYRIEYGTRDEFEFLLRELIYRD